MCTNTGAIISSCLTIWGFNCGGISPWETTVSLKDALPIEPEPGVEPNPRFFNLAAIPRPSAGGFPTACVVTCVLWTSSTTLGDVGIELSAEVGGGVDEGDGVMPTLHLK